MKATLEFTLPEETVEHRMAIHGMEFALVCSDVDEKLRTLLKHGHTYETADDAFEAARRLLHECLEDRWVNLEMIG